MKLKLPKLRLKLGRIETGALGAVLLVALGLRLWGGSFGLPHVYHPDEGFEIYRALRLAMGGFDFDRVAKGGYYFLLFIEYGVYFVLRFLTGGGGPESFAREFATDPSAFWRIGRATTALLGTATVFLVWWQARRMGSTRAGLLGGLFLAVSYRHIVDSHYVTVDVPMTLFAFWAVVMIVEDVSGRSRLSWWKFALVAAFAVLNKLPAVVLFVPYFAGVFLRGGVRGERGLLSRDGWLPPLAAGGVYLVANPGFIVHFFGMMAMVGHTLGGVEAAGEYAGVEKGRNLWAYYFWVLVKSQGPAALLLAVVGIALGITRRSRGVLLHLAFVVPFYLLIAGATSPHLFYARYIVPVLPGICLLAGLGLDELFRLAVRSPRMAALGAGAVAVLVATEPALTAVEWDRRHARKDTRTLAVEWIESNLEHRTRILLEGFPEEASQLSIPLRNTRRNVKEMIDRLESRDPGKARFWALKLDSLENPLYDLVTVRHYEPWITLDEARAAQAEYVVLRREYFVEGARSSKHGRETVESRYAFYRELESRPDAAQRVVAFDTDEDRLPGFEIEIWRLLPLAPEPAAEDSALVESR